MKKIIVAMLAVSMSLAVFGCSKTGDSGKNVKETEAVEETTEAEETTKAVEPAKDMVLDSSSVSVSCKNGTYIFEFVPGTPITENAWLGLVPAGKEYVTEEEADEVDIFWVGPDNYSGKSADENYKFSFYGEDIASIEDADYIMVLCDNDDGGKVILQFPLTKSGVELIPDFSKLKVN